MIPVARYVFDTNTLISAALIRQSVPRQALDRVLARGRLLFTVPTLLELHTVLARPKFDRYLTPDDRTAFFQSLPPYADIVEITETITACRDPKDDQFLTAAVNGQAAALITGDTDLLTLHPFRLIPILTPRVFLDA